MHEFRTYYDLADANGLVPELELIFADLARVHKEIVGLGRIAQAAGVRFTLDDVLDGDLDGICQALPSIGDRVLQAADDYLDILDDIADMGLVICDLDMGLVGFFSLFGGQEILLSWQFGEPEVAHWHGVTEHPEERRSLADLISNRRPQVSLH